MIITDAINGIWCQWQNKSHFLQLRSRKKQLAEQEKAAGPHNMLFARRFSIAILIDFLCNILYIDMRTTKQKWRMNWSLIIIIHQQRHTNFNKQLMPDWFSNCAKFHSLSSRNICAENRRWNGRRWGYRIQIRVRKLISAQIFHEFSKKKKNQCGRIKNDENFVDFYSFNNGTSNFWWYSKHTIYIFLPITCVHVCIRRQVETYKHTHAHTHIMLIAIICKIPIFSS